MTDAKELNFMVRDLDRDKWAVLKRHALQNNVSLNMWIKEVIYAGVKQIQGESSGEVDNNKIEGAGDE